jgi:phage baseplate assembly protein W
MTAKYTGMNEAGTGTLSDSDHLWQSVKDVLLTPLGSRVMRRTYGSLLPDLLDAPKNETTRLQLMSATVIALTQWEPRIALNQVDVIYSEFGAVTVGLSGLITTTMQATTGTVNLKEPNNGDN